MSDLDAKIDAALGAVEQDISSVTKKLQPLLNKNLDELSTSQTDSNKEIPYALGAYALSSLLFAYLRSEGKDTSVVLPELQKVKERMEQHDEKRKLAERKRPGSSKNKKSKKKKQQQ